ncbi:uncharacterized protein LOC134291327 [Aedes albopictus]|uniref:Endonuclease/exonuclease/phosphatase domain-containing protein n=1 Tax=Aedes albopictus TaxID=7160 RepID=A0ABM1ZZS7_AEDAL
MLQNENENENLRTIGCVYTCAFQLKFVWDFVLLFLHRIRPPADFFCHTTICSHQFQHSLHTKTSRNFTKFHELKQTFVDSKIDIICFTETWLNSTISDRMISIDGYKLVRNDRNRQGGGVCMYVRNNLSYKVVSMSSSSSNDVSGTEYLNVEIKVGYDKVLLGVVYNPPNTDCTDVLNDILENSTINYQCSFFVGDFNTDLLRSSRRSRRFSEMLDAMSYTCINSQPTFFHQTGCSLLDLLITDAPDVVVKQDQVSMSGVSNHDLVFCSLRLSFNKTEIMLDIATILFLHDLFLRDFILHDFFYAIFSKLRDFFLRDFGYLRRANRVKKDFPLIFFTRFHEVTRTFFTRSFFARTHPSRKKRI